MYAQKSRALNFTACTLIPLFVSPVWAAPFDTETKLTAFDATADDWFGWNVDLSDNVAIVGAVHDDDGGTSSGSAYLFDVATGNLLFKLAPTDPGPLDQFGRAVGISGNVAIVGAISDDDGGSGAGAAYLFDVTTGNQLFKLIADDADAGDVFGWSVGISGNIAVVGASHNSDAGDDSGSAYLFDVTTGNQLHKLTASDAAAGDAFGKAVAISGNTAIIGSRHDADAGADSGSAYLFDATTGNQLHKLTATDASAQNQFGFSVGIGGNTAIVGAVYDEHAGSISGSAYLFDVISGNQLYKLTSDDAESYDRFGWSVAIDGDTAMVGARLESDVMFNSGSAYLFDATSGNQLIKLNSSDADVGDNFGFSVAVDGNTAFVGAYFDDDAGNDSGSAYLFTTPGASGDFDNDGDVDGFDFLKWQRGESPNPFSASDLADWEAGFGTLSALANSLSVPEPATLGLCLAATGLWFTRLGKGMGSL